MGECEQHHTSAFNIEFVCTVCMAIKLIYMSSCSARGVRLSNTERGRGRGGSLTLQTQETPGFNKAVNVCTLWLRGFAQIVEVLCRCLLCHCNCSSFAIATVPTPCGQNRSQIGMSTTVHMTMIFAMEQCPLLCIAHI